jgi:PrtD family type I secretion system ABC transporter
MSGPLFRPSAFPVPLRSALGDIRFALIAVAGASFIVNLLMLVGPLFMLQVYDRVLPSRSLSTLIGLLLIAVLLLLVQAAVDALRSRLLARMGESFDQSIRGDVFACVQHQALKTPGNDGLQNIRDLDTLRGFMSGSGLIAACDLPWTPLYIIVCTLFHPLMGLAVAAGAIMLGVITWASETFGRRPTQALVGLAAARRSMAETVFSHAEVVHALGMSRRMGELWGARTDAFLDGQRVTSDLTGSFGSASRFLRMILQSGVLALGAWLVINQQATPGVMLAATILSIRALAPIELAIANWRGFIAARASFERLSEGLACLPANKVAVDLPKPVQQLRVNAVSLAIPRTETLVLHDVSFALQAGSAVAVVGPSGSGKSTLARALVGIVPSVRGVIRIDGAALAQWDPLALGASLGYLPQDVALFRGSVAQNISRFAAELDADRLLAAARQAGVHDLILRLPNGYETEVGDGGLMLSGGQRQRIALARALYGDPFLLVLDEPNSNLDSEGERALVRAIAAVRQRGGIVVVIAHRPALLSVVDHLLVLNQGRQQAFGTTDAVLPMLAPKQAAPPAEPVAPPAPKRASRKRAVAHE